MNEGGAGALVNRFRRASSSAAVASALLGGLVLCGWVFDITTFKNVTTGLVSMKPNTALCLLLLGSALWAFHAGRSRKFIFILSLVPVIVGGLTLVEYVFHVQLGIDLLLFPDASNAVQTSHPGRMAPNTALNFMLLGLAMLLNLTPRTDRVRAAEVLCLSAFVIALLPFAGYMYGVWGLIGYTQRFTEMALHTSVAFLVLSAGILFSRPEGGLMRLATSPGEAGLLMRLLLPLVVAALLILGWLRLSGENLGFFTSELGTALFVVLRVVLIGAIIIWIARIVYRLEEHREAARKQLEEANASLGRRVAERTAEIEAAKEELSRQHDLLSRITESGGILICLIDREGRIVRFNHACEEATGYPATEAVNRVFWDLFFPPAAEEAPGFQFHPVFSSGTPVSGENAWKTRTGEARWIRWNGVGLISSSGAVSHCVITGVDVTERRRAEERVWQNEERLRGIMDHLPVGVILSSGIEQTMIYQNPCFVNFFGYTLKEFSDVHSWFPLAYPDPEYRGKVASEWNRRMSEAILLQSDIEPMEVYITARDGSIKHISIHATVLGDLNFVTFIDLTDRQRAENAQRLDEMRLETLLQLNQMTKSSLKELSDFVLEEAVRLTSSKIGYLAFTSEDETVLNMYSWSRTAMKECDIRDKPLIYPVKDTGLWGEAIRQRAPVITNDYEAPNALKKGFPEGHVPVLRHMNIPVMDEGRIVAVAGVGNKDEPYDNTDVRQLTLLMEGMWHILQRRSSEDAVKQMRAYLQNVVDSMPSVLVGVDLDGNITHWNREASRLTGLSEDDARGREIGDVLPQLHAQLDKIRNAIRKGNALENERFTAHNGHDDNQIFDLMVFPLTANGTRGAVIRMDDVTNRVRIEEMMVQTEKMMSVGGLAAGMAHEINNPLGGILQACQNIERRTSLDLPKNVEVAGATGIDLENMRHYLQERGILDFISGIRADGTRAARIVADMLAFSRRSESHFAPVDIVDVVDTVLRLAANDYDLKKQYDFRNVRVLREFDPDLPQVQCDKTKIEQVLLNLVKNAAQAMAAQKFKNEPTISIHVRREPRHLRLDVRDNGPGMEERVRHRVFEPFFTTKEVGVGTGLGLSVSYFIITRQHKGTMTVESSPGDGTRFTIRLPLQEKG